MVIALVDKLPVSFVLDRALVRVDCDVSLESFLTPHQFLHPLQLWGAVVGAVVARLHPVISTIGVINFHQILAIEGLLLKHLDRFR